MPKLPTIDSMPQIGEKENKVLATKSKGFQTVKILVGGSQGAGKTSFINQISEVSVTSTTTGEVALDFGRITIDDNLVAYLFGNVSQIRFDFMMDILVEGMMGFIMIVDATRPESLREASLILSYVTKLESAPFLICVSKQDMSEAFAPEDIKLLLEIPDYTEIHALNTKDKDSLRSALLSMLFNILNSTEDKNIDSQGAYQIPKILSLQEFLYDIPSINTKIDTYLIDIAVEKLSNSDLAQYIWAKKLATITEQELWHSQLSYAYAVARYEGEVIGFARFYVNDAILVVNLTVPITEEYKQIGVQLLEFLHKRTKDLYAEVSIGIIQDGQQGILKSLGYRVLNFQDLESSQWRSAYKAENIDSAMVLQLTDRLLSPK